MRRAWVSCKPCWTAANEDAAAQRRRRACVAVDIWPQPPPQREAAETTKRQQPSYTFKGQLSLLRGYSKPVVGIGDIHCC